jgi:cobalt-zinc-cadmium efflux system outer membrane protein
MTRRFRIVTACGVLVASVSVGAQSSVPNPRDALASQYINTEIGITLDGAITRALEQEPTLRATRTDVDVARGAQLQAGLRPNPTVSFMQQQEPGGTDRQSRVDVQWPLDLFRKTGRVAVAEREVQASERAVEDRERMLAADVRTKYGEVVAAVRDLAVSDDVIAATTRQYDLLRARVDQGGTPPLERNMVGVELRRLEAERLMRAGQVDAAMIELKRLVGLPATASLQLRDTLEQLVARETSLPLRVETAAVTNRPDVLEADARIRVAEAQIDRAHREGRFDLSLLGSYTGMDAGFPQLGLDPQGSFTRVQDRFHYLSLGATLTVPLRNQNQGEIASAQAARVGATARFTAVQLTVQAEIAAATARETRARQALAVYRDGARNAARNNLDVVTQTYELGRATVFDVLGEQRRFLDLERAYSNTLREVYEARTALRRALGDVR